MSTNLELDNLPDISNLSALPPLDDLPELAPLSRQITDFMMSKERNSVVEGSDLF